MATPDTLLRCGFRLLMFSDWLELYSPGALPNTRSIKTIAAMSLLRNDVLCSLFARSDPVQVMGLGRTTLMDRRGMGVDVTLGESGILSGRRPVYETLGDMEPKLMIWAAAPGRMGGSILVVTSCMSGRRSPTSRQSVVVPHELTDELERQLVGVRLWLTRRSPAFSRPRRSKLTVPAQLLVLSRGFMAHWRADT